MKKILVTGSQGFVGKNLISTLETQDYEILTYDRDNTLDELKEYTTDCDFVFHLAGVNRTTNTNDFYKGNSELIEHLTTFLQSNKNTCPILVTSSIQSTLDNDYGKSKLAGEKILVDHSKKNNSIVYIYRLTNVFGKWSKPNYNSVIATWCYNINRNLDVTINNPDTELKLVYIDDVINSFLEHLSPIDYQEGIVTYPEVSPSYAVTLGVIYNLLNSFKIDNTKYFVPNLENEFNQKLYSTYLSYKPSDALNYELITHQDSRGSFSEFLKSDTNGQISINISKPGISKGNHWHHSKNEKFLTVKGSGVIRLRDYFSNEIVEYEVSDSKLEVIDIPPGYTHQIENTGEDEMIVIIWVNEVFNQDIPDTYYKEV